MRARPVPSMPVGISGSPSSNRPSTCWILSSVESPESPPPSNEYSYSWMPIARNSAIAISPLSIALPFPEDVENISGRPPLRPSGQGPRHAGAAHP